MAADNKSLGRFKLTGIPPAPRGIPQVQVAFDIDANGILQVTARDKMTGREQSVTIQGASTLSEGEINRMIGDAARFASEDRERRERVDKRNRARSLVDQAQRRLKDVTLDFGNDFTRSYRRQIESLSTEILDALEKNDDRRIDRASVEIQDVIYELNREVRLQYDEEDEGFFSAIRKTFTGDKEDDLPYEPRRDRYRDDYRGSGYRDDYRSDSGYGRDYRPPASDNYYNDRDNSRGRSPRPDDYSNNRGESDRSRKIPPQNNWDDEDDDWF
jgi:molecular chaperone DnaK